MEASREHLRHRGIKGRKFADGSKQRAFEASSTVSADGLIITDAIDGREGRDVCIMDIPG